jgi:hypothetical protein
MVCVSTGEQVMSNLPNWSGAEAVYSKAYAVLDSMAKRGHVTVSSRIVGRKNAKVCHVSDDMESLIKALNKGDEEKIKGLLSYRHIYY